MGSIHRGSVGNLIYLGEVNEVLEKALEDIKALLAEMMYETDQLRNVAGTWLDANPDVKLGIRCSSTPLRCIENENNLVEFFSIPWFR